MIADRFELLHLVGQGGMGTVYKAQAVGPHGFVKTVALKRILPELAADPKFQAMFVREAKLTAALSHANIVQMFELGRLSDSLYQVMEYVDGSDLGQVIGALSERADRLPLGIALHIGTEVCKALDFAHNFEGEGILHRDLSPSNILVSYAGEVKITDFGVADLARRCKTGMVDVAGKWEYMAPEQARGRSLDARSDLFSLGAVLYRAITGRRPFNAPTPLELVACAERGEMDPASSLRDEVPPELDRLVSALLAPDPADRPASAREATVAMTELTHAMGTQLDALRLSELLRGALDRPTEELESGIWLTQTGEDVTVLSRGQTAADGMASLQQHARPRVATLSLDGSAARRSAWRSRLTWVGAALAATVAGLALAAWISGVFRAEPPAGPVSKVIDELEPPDPKETTFAIEITTAPPGARTTLDERTVGKTPLVARELSPGRHRLVLRKRGFEPLRETIEIGPDPEPIHRKLQPITFGTLKISSEPWAEVWVDGKKTRRTTPAVLRLPAGKHELQLVNPVRKLRRTVTVTVHGNETELVQVELR